MYVGAGVCPGRYSRSNVFLFPFERSPAMRTSADIALTLSTLADSDVEPEVGGTSARCRKNSVGSASLDREMSDAGPEDRCSIDVDVMTSQPDSAADDDDDDVKRHRRHENVTVTSSAVTSPSKELKFGIDRILIKNDVVKDTSLIGTELVD